MTCFACDRLQTQVPGCFSLQRLIAGMEAQPDPILPAPADCLDGSLLQSESFTFLGEDDEFCGLECLPIQRPGDSGGGIRDHLALE